MTLPSVTLPRVGCGAFILDQAQRLLLIERRLSPEAGFWGLPGGKVEPFERVETAVVREIREELGIEIVLESLLCVSELIDAGQEIHFVNPVYVAGIVSGTATNREPEKISQVDWFRLTGVPHRLTAATRDALSAYASRREA